MQNKKMAKIKRDIIEHPLRAKNPKNQKGKMGEGCLKGRMDHVESDTPSKAFVCHPNPLPKDLLIYIQLKLKYHSVVVRRMNRLDAGRHPFIGSQVFRVAADVYEIPKMSAFAPYRKTDRVESKPSGESFQRTGEPYNGFVKPSSLIDWTRVLFGWPWPKDRPKIPFGSNGCRVRESPDDAKVEKEKFFIKNILKSEESTEREALEKRRRTFEEEASKMETIVSNLGKSDSGHRCIYCGKIYSRKYGLKIHIRTHTGYKPLKCKYCLRPFGDPSNLNKHIRLHARGQTPYNCRFCGKVLVRRRDLERHVKSKHGEPT